VNTYLNTLWSEIRYIIPFICIIFIDHMYYLLTIIRFIEFSISSLLFEQSTN